MVLEDRRSRLDRLAFCAICNSSFRFTSWKEPIHPPLMFNTEQPPVLSKDNVFSKHRILDKKDFDDHLPSEHVNISSQEYAANELAQAGATTACSLWRGETWFGVHDVCLILAGHYLGVPPVHKGVVDPAMTALYEDLTAFRRSIFNAMNTWEQGRGGYLRGFQWKTGGYGAWVYSNAQPGIGRMHAITLYNPAPWHFSDPIVIPELMSWLLSSLNTTDVPPPAYFKPRANFGDYSPNNIASISKFTNLPPGVLRKITDKLCINDFLALRLLHPLLTRSLLLTQSLFRTRILSGMTAPWLFDLPDAATLSQHLTVQTSRPAASPCGEHFDWRALHRALLKPVFPRAAFELRAAPFSLDDARAAERRAGGIMAAAPDGLWSRRRIWAALGDVRRELEMERGLAAGEEQALRAVLRARKLVREFEGMKMPLAEAVAGLRIGGGRALRKADVEAVLAGTSEEDGGEEHQGCYGAEG